MEPRELITVGELVRTAHLQLEVLAGGDGLERVVEWTHVSELEDPAQWLDGGELLITNGLGLKRTAAAQVQLLEQLNDVRAAGLAIGVRGPALTAQTLATADRLSFPLLRVPREVPFLAIARLVADANEDTARRRLTTHLRIFDTLRAESSDAAELFAELESISGYRLFLVSSNGRPLLPGMEEASEVAMQMLGASPGGGSDGPAVSGGFVVPVPMGHRTAAFLIAVDEGDRVAAGLGAVRHIATLAALELAKLYRDRESARRQGVETLSRLFSGELDAAAASERLREAGFDPDRPIVVAIFRAGGEEALEDEEVHHRLCDLGEPHLLLREGEELFVATPHPDSFEEMVEGLGVHVGVSEPYVGIGNWSLARKEAAWALERFRIGGDPDAAVARFSEDDAAVHWLPADVGALEELVSRALGPIIEYDEAHVAGMMLESLQVYFENDRRLQVSAKQLHVHKHTLAYRLRRIEEITGRDLSRLSDIVQLWLALRAHRILDQQPSARPAV